MTFVGRVDDNRVNTRAKRGIPAWLLLFCFVFLPATLSADDAVLLPTANDSMEARLELLGSGDEIHIGSYIFGNDAASRKLLAAVRAAARRGATVNIIADAFENQMQKGMMRHLMTDPECGGRIRIRVYHPLSLYNPLEFLYRLHAKWLVSRNATTGVVTAVVGGRNSWKRSLETDQDTDKDIDMLIRGESAQQVLDFAKGLWEEKAHVREPGAFDSLIDFKRAFNVINYFGRPPRSADWIRSTADHGDSPMPRPQHWVKEAEVDLAKGELDAADRLNEEEARKRSATKWSDAAVPVGKLKYVADRVDGRDRIVPQILETISHAKKSVVISSAYLTVPHELEYAIADARKNGAEVTILTNSSQSSDVALVQAAYEQRIQRLLNLGVKVYEYRQDHLLHEKLVVVDGEHTFLGSVNMDPRSAGWNLENGVFSESPEIASQVTANIQKGMEGAALISSESDVYIPKRCFRWWLRLKARILHRTL